MPQSPEALHLVVIYRPRLTLAWWAGDPGEQLVVDGTPYKSKVESDFTGFYDRMYDEAGRFLGLQVLPLLAEQYLSNVLARFEYVRPTSGIQFRVFLAGHPDERPRIIDDQGFGGRIYEAIDGEFAMSFDLSWLSQSDVEGIRGATADWVELGPGSVMTDERRA